MAIQNGQYTPRMPINKGFVENVNEKREFVFCQKTALCLLLLNQFLQQYKPTLRTAKINSLGRKKFFPRQREKNMPFSCRFFGNGH